MKRVLIILSLVLFFSSHLAAQKIDSIKVEQSGDFIKIHYKILGSNPNQVFRVSALCSIEGGLKSQMNSIVGDFGENITGGRNDYMIIWDVLKDIPELKSAEFFVKAELIKDLSIKPEELAGAKGIFSGSKFSILLATDFPGPQYGFRIGYMGSFGISIQLLYGKIPVAEKYKNTSYSGPDQTMVIGLDLTKRIVKRKNFEMHLIGGIRNNDLLIYFAGPPSPVLWNQGMTGPEVGMVFVVKKITVSGMYSQLNPKQLEKNDEKVVIASPYKFFNIGMGLRF
jgi:hypothetical protein